MKVILLIAILITAFLFSFNTQDREGKILFERNCGGCHYPNKAKEFASLQIAPSFQNIRKDYGLKWTVSFIQTNYKMLAKKDTRTLYSYYLFGKMKHVSFPAFEEKYIVKILDYVDGFPDAPSQYKHRLVSVPEKLKYVNEQVLKDTVEPMMTVTADTSNYNQIDTANDGRRSRRRSVPKQD